MLHFILGFIVSALLIGNAMAACEAEEFNFVKRSLFFNDENTVSVPLQLNEKPSCYYPKQKLSIVADSLNESEIDFTINPMVAEFENIPDPVTHHLVFIESNENNEKKISLTSYHCSGEIPLGADAISDTLQNIADRSTEEDEDGNIFISTGQGAQNITVSKEQKARAKVFDRFSELYEERTGEDVTEDQTSNIYVPNVMLALSQDPVSRKVYSSFFARSSSSINGCSKKFLNAMGDLLIDNVAKTKPFTGIDIRKKMFTGVYQLNWKINVK